MLTTELNGVISKRMSSIFPLNRGCDLNDHYLKTKVYNNTFDKLQNPQGVINLGVAFSFICDDIVNEKLRSITLQSGQLNVCYVRNKTFHQSLVDLYTRKLSPSKRLVADQLIVTNGLNSTLDVLAHVIADPGDIICTPTPTYAYFSRNFFVRSQVELWPINIFDDKVAATCIDQFELTATKVKVGLENAIKQGKVVRAFLLANPSNPSGTVYSENIILSIMEVCAKFKIHVIIDECCSFCMLNEVKFKSVVAFDRIPDPDRTHVLWTFTKCFSLVGARIAVIYSFSPEVLECFNVLNPFYPSSLFSHNVCQEIVEDQHWCDEIYFPTLVLRLRDCYRFLADELTKLGAVVHPVDAGFTMLVSFRKFLKSDTFESELDLLNHLLKFGVYVVPGQFMSCPQPGWFRITFSKSKDIIKLGFDRIRNSLTCYSASAD